MKNKTLLSIIIFCIGFVVTYLIMCYLPPFRIKLHAEPFEYFIASIRHMMLFKGIISFIFGILLAIIPEIKKSKLTKLNVIKFLKN